MTKNEFLEKLKSALGNDLSGPIIQENVNYYSDYISGEVRNGRSEAEVIAELGDPWAIAKTIIGSVENRSGAKENYSYEPNKQRYEQQDYDQQQNTGRVHVFGLDAWWKKLVLILGIVGIIVLVVAVISGVISLLSPILLPIIIIMIIFRFIGNQ